MQIWRAYIAPIFIHNKHEKHFKDTNEVYGLQTLTNFLKTSLRRGILHSGRQSIFYSEMNLKNLISKFNQAIESQENEKNKNGSIFCEDISGIKVHF